MQRADSVDQPASSRAEALFAEFLVDHDAGLTPRLDSLCAKHPDLAHELRSLYMGWKKITAAIDRARGQPLLYEELKNAQGRDVDPGITLSRFDADGKGTDSAKEPGSASSQEPGKYVIQEEIAQGGMGVIYRVWDPTLRRPLAMKVATPGGKLPGPAILRRFLEEAQITGQLDHPGIVPVHELGMDSRGRLFFTMRLVRGRDLSAVIRLARAGEDGWSVTRVLPILLKVCEAMAFAHEKGVLHRDLKPANIMVGRFGETYVMDWGLARLLHGRSSAPAPEDGGSGVQTRSADERRQGVQSPLRTMCGDVVGTPCYMSPEQASGNLELLGPQSDIYSVGAIIYHLLAGHAPYRPNDRVDNREIVDMIMRGPPPGVSSIAPQAPRELVAICEKAMARDPADRYASMMEMAGDIEAHLGMRRVRARSPSLGYLLRLAMLRNKAASVTAAIGFVVLLMAGFLFVLRLGRANREMTHLADFMAAQALLSQEREELTPLVPEQIPATTTWVARAEQLLARLPAYQHRLETDDHGLNPLDDSELRIMLDRMRQLSRLLPVMKQQLKLAASLEQLTVRDEMDTWREAIADVGSLPVYGGLTMQPQRGLVPLQKNPRSGLWEFWHAASGEMPLVSDSGEIQLEEDSGMVLVLIPGGSFQMGAPLDEDGSFEPAGGPPRRDLSETAHNVTLEPYLVSKYEVTQAQWERVMGENPSLKRDGTREGNEIFTGLNPVETISWFDAERFLHRVGLTFPTEAQWECACRAGTKTAYYWGNDRGGAERRENILDQSLPIKELARASWNDAHPHHAAVGSFEANPFGLFDIAGNVSEWCADFYVPEYLSYPRRTGDGLHLVGDAARRVFRGGSCYLSSVRCRSAFRQLDVPKGLNYSRGLRPAQMLQNDHPGTSKAGQSR